MQRVLSLLIFLIVFLGGIFYIRPLWGEVSNFTSARDQSISERDTLSQQLAKLQQAQSDVSQSSEVSHQLSLNAIPEHFNQAEIIQDFEQMAAKNDVQVTTTQYNVTTSNLDKVKRGTMTLSVQSDESKLIDFLKSIESSERKYVVKNISVSTGSQSENGTAPRITFNLTVEAYFLNSL